MSPLAIVTIVSNNYLHFARTLLQSVAQHHPEAQRYCVIVDRDLSHAQTLADEFSLLSLDQLDLPDGDAFLFQDNVLELNTAVKPWALQHLMEKGHQRVLYIDPDIVLYRPLAEAIAPLGEQADIVFTPHLLAPATDDQHPGELDIRRSGTYNLGFCALNNSDNTRRFLGWWQQKLRRECIIAHDRGIFVDQSWMDLVPGLFPRTFILRHPGYNVAYWNLAQRQLSRDDTGILVNGQPLVFFHYSGLDPLAPQRVSKHQNRYTLDTVCPLTAELIRDYCQRVITNNIAFYKALTYGFSCYDDGTPITDSERSRYRISDRLRRDTQERPFSNKRLIAQPRTPDAPGNASQPASAPYFSALYAHLLGRTPDSHAQALYLARPPSRLRHLVLVLSTALSPEARSKPGWLQRLMCWPLRHALHTPPEFPIGNHLNDAPRPGPRPSPYGGLSAPEADSPQNGIWVGPRLDLPTMPCSHGRIRITGTVDIDLLRKGGAKEGQTLHIHGPLSLLFSHPIKDSGAFEIEHNIDPAAFAEGNQWVIIASAHTVPKQAGMGEDTRQLAWRVKQISVDDQILIDTTRSPVTRAITEISPVDGINLIGYLSAELGLGEAARSLASACVAQDIPYSAIDVGYQSSNLQRDTRLLAHATQKHYPIDLIYVNADQTATTDAYLNKNHARGQYRIGFWHWEQPRLPDSALGAFAYLDEVWVPSTFVHDAVAPCSPVPVVKIPHALEFTPSAGVHRRQFNLPEDKLLVLVMYDFHSYQYRKNPQAALAAYRKAAANNPGTALVIKTINSQHHPQARDELKNSVADLGNIIFIDDFLTRQQTWDLQSCCDILLSLHRAEGFGLAPAEMMYLGKPVIATGWSANMDFMTADNSFPVRYQLKRLSEAVGVYPAGQDWAEADTDHAADCLARLIESDTLRHSIGQQAAADIRRQLSPQAVGALIKERLSLLGFWLPHLRP